MKERIAELEKELETINSELETVKASTEKYGRRRAAKRLREKAAGIQAELDKLRKEMAEEKSAEWQADKLYRKATRKVVHTANPVEDLAKAKEDLANPASKQVRKAAARKAEKAQKAVDRLWTREMVYDRLITVLSAKLATVVVDTFNLDDLRKFVARYDVDAIMAAKGIGEKRADVIVKALRPICWNMRLSTKAEAREKAKGFNVRTFASNELFRDVITTIQRLREYHWNKKDAPSVRQAAVELLKQLKSQLDKKEPFTVRRSEGRVTRLTRFDMSDVFGVDYDSKRPNKDYLILEHQVQELFDFDWHLFASEEEEGLRLLDELQQTVLNRIGYYGVKAVEKDDSYLLYGGIASSATHQKDEKLLMGESKLLKKHEKFLWFGLTMQEFLAKYKLTGAEYWKMRANEIRPIMKPFVTADGQRITIKDVLFVKDVKKIYKILHARIFGDGKGKVCRDGQKSEPVILGDGAILALCKLLFSGQATAPGLKGMIANSWSALLATLKKHGITLKEFLDTEVEGLDGEMHRIGDYKLVCGEGCWKFDKAFDSITDYVDWLTEMAEYYPGIDQLYLLRQAEEVEGEEKIRKLTGTLIQQWICLTPREQRLITAKARASLRKQKTFRGAVSKLAALWKSDGRTTTEDVFKAAPWLVLNPAIQAYLEERWYANQTEAMSGKFRTEGQYPYIMQDPVALYEVWLFGMDPNDPTLGLLRGDEVSCADVPDGKKLVCVRFPANFLTAKVMKNRAFADEYESMGGIAVLSIYSDILIRQDGDVDGDEMCVLYSSLIVSITERMLKTFNPPVVLFEHGGKAERKVLGDYATFTKEAYKALWRAKRYDSVGIYANLATACAYLASIAYAMGDTKQMNVYLLWMSAASTGAILAIDQVKGNAVDEQLIKWLEDLRKKVLAAIRKYAEAGVQATIMDNLTDEEHEEVLKDLLSEIKYPYVHYFVSLRKRRPVEQSACARLDTRSLRDSLCDLIRRDTGTYQFDAQGVVWNKGAAAKALLDWSFPMLNNSLPVTAVRTARVTAEMLQKIGDNWANRQQTDEAKEFFRRVRSGEPVGLKMLLTVLWQNESAMCHHMEGRNLLEKKAEYRITCKEILYALADGVTWTNKNPEAAAPVGYEFTKAEKHAAIANSAIIDALELQRPNSIGKAGSYAMFVIGIFADELLANIRRNGYKFASFLDGSEVVDDDIVDEIELETMLDILSDEDELYQQDSAEVDSIPDDYVSEHDYIPEEDTMWFGPDDEDDFPVD